MIDVRESNSYKYCDTFHIRCIYDNMQQEKSLSSQHLSTVLIVDLDEASVAAPQWRDEQQTVCHLRVATAAEA